MSDIIVTVGLDLAKNIFWVHGVDADERVWTVCGANSAVQ